MMKYFLIVAALLMSGCDFLADQSTAETQNIDSTYYDQLADCRSCHLYPAQSGSHMFHLFKVSNSAYPTGQITCADCHYGSIITDSTANISEWGDTTSVHIPDLSHIDSTYANASFAVIQGVLTQYFGQAGNPNKLIKLRTGPLHNNGKIDVVFAPQNIMTGQTGTFHSMTGKCDACHGLGDTVDVKPMEYKW